MLPRSCVVCFDSGQQIADVTMANSRNTLFIDRKVQGALARRIAVHWCTFLLLASMCLFAQEYFLGEPNTSVAEKLVAVASEYAFFFLLLICMVPAFLYDTLKLSNRFVGPILRLKNSLRSVADGNPVSPIRFRGGDFWHELADDFNRLNSKLGGAIQNPSVANAKSEEGQLANPSQSVVPPVQVTGESSQAFENPVSQ